MSASIRGVVVLLHLLLFAVSSFCTIVVTVFSIEVFAIFLYLRPMGPFQSNEFTYRLLLSQDSRCLLVLETLWFCRYPGNYTVTVVVSAVVFDRFVPV